MRGDLLHSLENFFSSLRTIPYFFVFFSFLIFYLVYFLNGGYSLQGKGLPDTGFRPGCRVLSTATSRRRKPAWGPASWLLPASVLIPLTKLGCALTEKKDSEETLGTKQNEMKFESASNVEHGVNSPGSHCCVMTSRGFRVPSGGFWPRQPQERSPEFSHLPPWPLRSHCGSVKNVSY